MLLCSTFALFGLFLRSLAPLWFSSGAWNHQAKHKGVHYHWQDNIEKTHLPKAAIKVLRFLLTHAQVWTNRFITASCRTHLVVITLLSNFACGEQFAVFFSVASFESAAIWHSTVCVWNAGFAELTALVHPIEANVLVAARFRHLRTIVHAITLFTIYLVWVKQIQLKRGWMCRHGRFIALQRETRFDKES